MLKKLTTITLLTLASACSPAHATQALGFANFTADGKGQTRFEFYDQKQSASDGCFLEGALRVTLNVIGPQQGATIAYGCWNVAGNNDLNVQLYEGNPISGIISIRRKYLQPY